MPLKRRFFLDWLPVILWMMFIFIGSTDVLSSAHTSRFLVPFLRWLKPDISQAALAKAQFMVRKAGHISEYAILSILLWRAFPRPESSLASSWYWRGAAVVLPIVALYAASDEVHQSFYRSRFASVWDVSLDTIGAAVGLALVWAVGRWRKRW
ncbi:MAG: VanZ family protein [Candidatus Omnitrophica bacterium]|nr:VanZ family protein [Candidatus Omnitrophota bacterium]